MWQWTRIPAIAHRNFSETWALVQPWYTVDLQAANGPNAPNCGGPMSGPSAIGTAVLRILFAYATTKICTAIPAARACGRTTW